MTPLFDLSAIPTTQGSGIEGTILKWFGLGAVFVAAATTFWLLITKKIAEILADWAEKFGRTQREVQQVAKVTGMVAQAQNDSPTLPSLPPQAADAMHQIATGTGDGGSVSIPPAESTTPSPEKIQKEFDNHGANP